MFKNWTDITSGKLTIGQVMEDVARQMIHRSPKRIIIDIQRKEPTKDRDGGYWTTIWLSSHDFSKWK